MVCDLMEWRDEAIILAARPHGETSLILQVLTREHGRHLKGVEGLRSRINGERERGGAPTLLQERTQREQEEVEKREVHHSRPYLRHHPVGAEHGDYR